MMMKRMLSIAFGISMLIAPAAPQAAAAADNVQVQVNGQLVKFPDALPYITDNGRTMVPVRFVSEALGAQVDWIAAAQTVQMTKNGMPIALKVGEKKAQVNSKTIYFDAAATLKDSRTFVPLRFVSESFGAKVTWNSSTRLVTITTSTTAPASAKPAAPQPQTNAPEAPIITKIKAAIGSEYGVAGDEQHGIGIGKIVDGRKKGLAVLSLIGPNAEATRQNVVTFFDADNPTSCQMVKNLMVAVGVPVDQGFISKMNNVTQTGKETTVMYGSVKVNIQRGTVDNKLLIYFR